jgi:hypothetical protein
MKISQLVKREDFYNILNNTIKTNSFILNIPKSDGEEIFKSYQYLNLISSDKASKNCRDVLVNEYKLSASKVKKIVQKLYVTFVFLPVITNIFVHKRLSFSKTINKYAIVGGNHRIRLFDNKMQNIVVLLKTGENKKFILNDIESRITYTLNYAPKILSFGDDWLMEEFIEGVPLNRIDNVNLLNESLDATIKLHMNNLVYKTKKEIPVENYLNETIYETKVQIELIKTNNSLKMRLLNTLKNIENKIFKENISVIETSINHGDFQKGNIRIKSSKELVVLDWESTDKRFYLYDLFTILSGRREGIGLEKGLNIFFDKCNSFDTGFKKYSKELITFLICLEDLKFNIFEDVSINYYNPGIKSGVVAAEIDSIVVVE